MRGLVNGAKVFFQNNIMFEVACEPNNNCNTDQLSFKAYLSRWMAASIKVAPFVGDLVREFLTTSAQAAAKSCSGGADGATCGTKWTLGAWDNSFGVGQQMSALEVVQGLLIDSVPGPVSNTTGGISKGDPTAGTGGDRSPGAPTSQITTGDRAGAGILTAVILVGLLGGAWYVSMFFPMLAYQPPGPLHPCCHAFGEPSTDMCTTQVDGRVRISHCTMSVQLMRRRFGFGMEQLRVSCTVPLKKTLTSLIDDRRRWK